MEKCTCKMKEIEVCFINNKTGRYFNQFLEEAPSVSQLVGKTIHMNHDANPIRFYRGDGEVYLIFEHVTMTFEEFTDEDDMEDDEDGADGTDEEASEAEEEDGSDRIPTGARA